MKVERNEKRRVKKRLCRTYGKKIHFLRAFPDKGSFDDGLTVEKKLSPLSLETQ